MTLSPSESSKVLLMDYQREVLVEMIAGDIAGAFRDGDQVPRKAIAAALSELDLRRASEEIADKTIRGMVAEASRAGLPNQFFHVDCIRQLVDEYLNLRRRSAGLRIAASRFLARYIRGVQSGDWGNWNAEEEPEVIAMRAAMSQFPEAADRGVVVLAADGLAIAGVVVDPGGLNQAVVVRINPPGAEPDSRAESV